MQLILVTIYIIKLTQIFTIVNKRKKAKFANNKNIYNN